MTGIFWWGSRAAHLRPTDISIIGSVGWLAGFHFPLGWLMAPPWWADFQLSLRLSWVASLCKLALNFWYLNCSRNAEVPSLSRGETSTERLAAQLEANRQMVMIEGGNEGTRGGMNTEWKRLRWLLWKEPSWLLSSSRRGTFRCLFWLGSAISLLSFEKFGFTKWLCLTHTSQKYAIRAQNSPNLPRVVRSLVLTQKCRYTVGMFRSLIGNQRPQWKS